MAVSSPARALLLAGVLCAAVAPAARGAPADARPGAARAHYESGVAHYNLDEFAAALAEFTEAYRTKPDPSYLFDIAQCHRKLGNADAAIDYYRKYLRNKPDAPNRDDVERTIAELRVSTRRAEPSSRPAEGEAQMELAPLDRGSFGPAIATPVPAARAPALVPPSSGGPNGTSASLLATRPAAPPPAKSTFYRRPLFWIAVGGVAATLLIGALLATSSDAPYVGSLGTTHVP
jgi:tetratricopeptide (TPR) repeat protein